MNDFSQLMKMAQALGMNGGGAPASDVGARVTLAFFAAAENPGCSCEACAQLRGAISDLKAQLGRGAAAAPRSLEVT